MPSLFLKDQKVLTLNIVENGFEVVSVDNPELLPVFLQKEPTTEMLNKWLHMRRIPERRDGFDTAKKMFGEQVFESQYLTGNHASLSDQYWIQQKGESWKTVNFFLNRYPTEIGDMFFNPYGVKKKKINPNSPDYTTNGVLRKRWKQNADKTSILIKAGCQNAQQDPLNEVLASAMGELVGKIPVVHYELCTENGIMCNKSKNFITQDTELVPASHFYSHEKRAEGENSYTHLLRMCEKQEIEGAEEFLKWMIFIDNITGNEDRNIGNIGFIRDVNTMKYIGPAPLYDMGNAYWNTANLTKPTCSKFFGGIEAKICTEMAKKSDLKFTKSTYYMSVINSYPYYSQNKKEKLVEAIKQKNKMIQNELQIKSSDLAR